LHLDTQEKVWLEQEGHLDEIWIWLKSLYEKENAEKFEEMRKEVEAEMKELNDEEKIRAKEIEKDFDNPIGDELF